MHIRLMKEKNLQTILDKLIDEKKIFGTSFGIKKEAFEWLGASGNIATHQPYFIASTTKLFTTVLVLRLIADGNLKLDAPISNYLDNSVTCELHKYKGKDYSNLLTIKHLLSHTSGLPDYFQDKDVNGSSLEQALLKGRDQFWTFEQSMERTKSIQPLFAPGTKNKAHYSDANFQLLGKIIENITRKTYSENCRDEITKPLRMLNTYVYNDPTDSTPMPLYYKNKELNIPKAMTSFGADGSIVSTTADLLIFIEAFFNAKLFPDSYLNALQDWNDIFFPFRAGIGIHLFKLPWLLNPTGTIPPFVGHSGLSGALAYYSPRENVFVAGTVNQVAYPDMSFKTMIQLTQALLKK